MQRVLKEIQVAISAFTTEHHIFFSFDGQLVVFFRICTDLLPVSIMISLRIGTTLCVLVVLALGVESGPSVRGVRAIHELKDVVNKDGKILAGASQVNGSYQLLCARVVLVVILSVV
jgi:hypothetical protein